MKILITISISLIIAFESCKSNSDKNGQGSNTTMVISDITKNKITDAIMKGLYVSEYVIECHLARS